MLDLNDGNDVNSENNELENLKQQTIQMVEHCKNVNGEVIVPFFGYTGVGKSLLINLLSNCKLITVKNEMDLDVLDFEDAKTKVGQTLESETSTPICVRNNDCEYIILDCPGFFDNRGDLTRLMVNLSIRLSIQQALQVKGIVIMIDIDDLINRSSKFNETASLFGTMLKEDFPEKSMIVVINNKKGNKVNRYTVNKAIELQLQGAKSRWLRLAQQTASFLKFCSDGEKESASVRFLNLLHSNLDRVFLLDVNNQNSIVEIKKAINNLCPVSCEYFETNTFDETWNRYNNVIRKVMEESIKFYDNYVNIKRLMDQQKTNIAELNTRIESYSDRLKEIQKTNIEKESEQVDYGLQRLYSEKKDEIKRLTQELDALNLLIKKTQFSRDELLKKQKELDSEEEKQIFKEQISEKRNSILGWISYTAKTIEYDAQCPFREEKTITTGKLQESKKHSSTYYHKYYFTNWGEDAEMSLILFAKKKDLPGNIIMSAINRNELQNIEEELKVSQQKKLEKEESIKGIELLLVGIEAGKLSVEEKKMAIMTEFKDVTNKIENFKRLIQQSNAELQRLKEIFQKEEAHLSEVEDKTNGIESAFQLLCIEENFANCYKKSKERFTTYKTGNKPNIESGEVEVLDSLICPISFQIMIDPILLPCCNHTIDRDSLYRAFASKSTCPLCRRKFDLSKVMQNKSLSDLVEVYRKLYNDQLPDSYLKSKSSDEICKMENEVEKRIQELKQQLEKESKKLDRIKEAKQFIQNPQN